jgi:hypothetical protein
VRCIRLSLPMLRPAATARRRRSRLLRPINGCRLAGARFGNTSTKNRELDFHRAKAGRWLPCCTLLRMPWVASFFPARLPAPFSWERGSSFGPKRRCTRTSPLLAPRGHVRRRCFPSGRRLPRPLLGPSRGRASETAKGPVLGKRVPMRGRRSGTGCGLRPRRAAAAAALRLHNHVSVAVEGTAVDRAFRFEGCGGRRGELGRG